MGEQMVKLATWLSVRKSNLAASYWLLPPSPESYAKSGMTGMVWEGVARDLDIGTSENRGIGRSTPGLNRLSPYSSGLR